MRILLQHVIIAFYKELQSFGLEICSLVIYFIRNILNIQFILLLFTMNDKNYLFVFNLKMF